jgi:hypothetical protein
MEISEDKSESTKGGRVAPVASLLATGEVSRVARPRSSAGRGAPDEIDATPTTPRADLGVPHTDAPVPVGTQVAADGNLCHPSPFAPLSPPMLAPTQTTLRIGSTLQVLRVDGL